MFMQIPVHCDIIKNDSAHEKARESTLWYAMDKRNLKENFDRSFQIKITRHERIFKKTTESNR